MGIRCYICDFDEEDIELEDDGNFGPCLFCKSFIQEALDEFMDEDEDEEEPDEEIC